MDKLFKSLLQIMKMTTTMFCPIQAIEIYFPEEIIVEILIRLPVQSLLRFKCVSKSWNVLISDPYFKAKHCNHAKNNKKILTVQLFPEDRTLSYHCASLSLAQPLQKIGSTSNHTPRGYNILCCCDGLALVWCRGGDHLLWNPSTNESKQLPKELPYHEFLNVCARNYGMGYDSISDDYKILWIEDMNYATRPPNKILALKSGSWRTIDNHPRCFRNSIVLFSTSLAFVRGAFHWIGKDNLCKYFMISFNISNEVYGEMSLPDGICNISDGIFVSHGISVLEGMLCAYYTRRNMDFVGTFKLWVMKDYDVKESWTELFTIREPNLFLAIPEYMFADGEVLLFYKKGLDCEFKTSKGPYELLSSNSTLILGCVYTKSLISPKSLI